MTVFLDKSSFFLKTHRCPPPSPLSLNTRTHTHTQLTCSSTTLHSNGEWTPLLLSKETHCLSSLNSLYTDVQVHLIIALCSWYESSKYKSSPCAHNGTRLGTKNKRQLDLIYQCIHFVGHWIWLLVSGNQISCVSDASELCRLLCELSKQSDRNEVEFATMALREHSWVSITLSEPLQHIRPLTGGTMPPFQPHTDCSPREKR